MSLKEIPTERLLTWKHNVLKVRNEYRKGTHECYPTTCLHCKESVKNSETCKHYVCNDCIWKYMLYELNDNTDRRMHCVSNTKSNMDSKHPYHNKQEHISRCNLWLKTINKELKSRS